MPGIKRDVLDLKLDFGTGTWSFEGTKLSLSDHFRACESFARIELEVLHGFRCDPARAQLGAGKGRPIQDQHIEARLAQPPGAGRPGGPAAYDDGVRRLHASACPPLADTGSRASTVRYCCRAA